MTERITEKDIERQVRLVLGKDSDSAWWLNPVGFDHDKKIRYGLFKGSADIIGCYRGRFIGLELKSPIGRQSPEQRMWQVVVERYGGIYQVVRSPDEAHDFLADLRRRSP